MKLKYDILNGLNHSKIKLKMEQLTMNSDLNLNRMPKKINKRGWVEEEHHLNSDDETIDTILIRLIKFKYLKYYIIY